MTTRIIALIALLALLATPPRTTGRTRRFNSIANKSFCSSQTRESESPLSLPLSLSRSLSLSQPKKFCTHKNFKNPHILVFTKARTNNHAVRLSLPPSLLSFRRRSRCSFYSARTSQLFAFLSFAWYRARRCLFTRIFIFIFFFFRCFLRARGSCRSKISDIVTFSLSSSRSEIVHIQAGQCGNQIGAKFWEVREGFLSFFSIAVVSCSFFHFRACVPVGGF